MTKKLFHLGVINFMAYSAIFFQSVRPQDPQDNVKRLSEANLKFAVDFYKAVVSQGTQKSFISSPFSVSTLFSMLYVGSGKETAQEIQESLGYDEVGLDIPGVQNAYDTALGSNSGEKFGADIANSAWVNKYFEVTNAYKECLETNFDATLREVDFGDASTTDAINDWVNQKTHEKIPTLFDDPLPSSTSLALVNAVYFKGTWKTTFPTSKTELADFHGEDGTSKKQMMNVQSGFKFYKSSALDSQVLQLDYANGNNSMLIILPNKKDNLKTLERDLKAESIQEAIDGVAHVPKVNVTIPKFTLQTRFDLIPIMKNLNVSRVFDSRADLSGISNLNGLFVTEAVQKAFVDVNEEGTEAAAASGAAVGRSVVLIKDFRADHPFLYLIRNADTNMVLFMGRVA